MQAKILDPFDEDVLNAWLATTPVKVIHSAQVFDTKIGGNERQVALVFFDEERELGYSVTASTATVNPLGELLDPFFHPERFTRRGASLPDTN